MAYAGGDVGAFRAVDGRWWVRLWSRAESCVAIPYLTTLCLSTLREVAASSVELGMWHGEQLAQAQETPRRNKGENNV